MPNFEFFSAVDSDLASRESERETCTICQTITYSYFIAKFGNWLCNKCAGDWAMLPKEIRESVHMESEIRTVILANRVADRLVGE